MVRLTDRPDMTLDVYRGRETTMQQCIAFALIWPIAARVFHTCHCYIHDRSVKKGVISFNCLSFAKYWVIKQVSDSLDN